MSEVLNGNLEIKNVYGGWIRFRHPPPNNGNNNNTNNNNRKPDIVVAELERFAWLM
jgi:hypothetical protein